MISLLNVRLYTWTQNNGKVITYNGECCYCEVPCPLVEVIPEHERFYHDKCQIEMNEFDMDSEFI